MRPVNYRELELSLEEAGELVIRGLDAVNSYAAAFTDAADPTAAAAPAGRVSIHIGGENADRVNLVRKPLFRAACGIFGLVRLEWEASPGVLLELTLGDSLDIGVVAG